MKTPDEILDMVKKAMPYLQREYSVRHLAVFGSVARRVGRPVGDVAVVVVEFEGTATFDRYMGVKFHLEDLLGLRVDLVTRKALRPELVSRIEEESVHVA